MIKRTSLVDDVVNAFLKDVKEGKYQYGEKLPSQKFLSNHYQVSLIVLREALSKLSAIGMVRFHQGKGTFLVDSQDRTSEVSSDFSSLIFHDINNLRSIVEARQVVEQKNCYFAANRRTEEDLKEINQVIEKMDQNLHNYTEFAKWDLEFHISLAKASKNIALQKITILLIDSYRNEVPKFYQIPGVIEKVLQEHIDIYDYIRNRKGMDASNTMTAHLELPEKIFIEKLNSQK